MTPSPPFHRLLPLFTLLLLAACTTSLEQEVADAGSDTSGETEFGDTDTSLPFDVENGSEEGDPTEPILFFLSPPDGALVPNPVTFTFVAEQVSTVQIEADEWPLSPQPWDPDLSTSLTYTFAGTGFERQIRLIGYDSDGEEIIDDLLTITVEADAEPPGPGTPLGTFENTYYYLAEESAHTGPATSNLYDPNCEVLATVSSSFATSACIEGTARLNDGRVLSYFLPCSCGGPCSFCWSVMNPDTHPWGKGSQNNALEPLRSWATDTSLIPFGTVLYVEEWDGLELPNPDGLGGYAHDGCFRADDVGGAINNYHVDIFAGSRAMWQALETVFPTRTQFTVYGDSPRCAHL